MSAWASETHALEAVRWAKAPYPSNPEKTNWDVFFEKVSKEARNPYKRTIMRYGNEQQLVSNAFTVRDHG